MRHLSIAIAALSIAAAAGAIELGPEVQVAPAVVREASGLQYFPAVASAGGDSLVAWQDQTHLGIYVATISADGNVSPARRIFSGLATQAQLCWTGSTYLAAWYDAGHGIRSVALLRDGTPTGDSHLVAPKGFDGALAWNGQRALLVYQDQAVYGTSAAMLLDAQANVVRAGIAFPNSFDTRVIGVADGKFFVFQSARSASAPAGSFAPDSTAVVRVDGDGTLLDAAPRIVVTPGEPAGPSVVFDGKRFALVAAVNGRTSLRRYLLDPSTLGVSSLPPVAANAAGGASVALNGGSFVALWVEYPVNLAAPRELRSLSFDAAATPSVIAANPVQGPAAAFNGAGLVVTWMAGSGGDIYGEILDPTATRAAGAPFVCSTGPAEQSSPASAPGLVAWLEPASDTSTELFAAHSAAGGFGGRVQVSKSSVLIPPQAVAVVFTGSTYLLAWQEDAPGGIIMTRRLGADGTPLDAEPVTLGRGVEPSLGFDGRTILLAYGDGDVKGLRFDRDGKSIDAAPFRIAADSKAHSLSVASNGAAFLVVWLHEYTIQCCSEGPSTLTLHDLYGVRVGGDAAVLDAQPIPIAVGGAITDRKHPALASSGGDYLVAFASTAYSFPLSGFGPPETATRVLAVRLLKNGTVSGAPVELERGPVAFSPAIGADLTGYWIAWGADDLFLAHIGAALDVAPAMVVRGATQPAFGSGALTYSRAYDAEQQLVFARTLPLRSRSRAAGH
jgi:hypothetical protein